MNFSFPFCLLWSMEVLTEAFLERGLRSRKGFPKTNAGSKDPIGFSMCLGSPHSNIKQISPAIAIQNNSARHARYRNTILIPNKDTRTLTPIDFPLTQNVYCNHFLMAVAILFHGLVNGAPKITRTTVPRSKARGPGHGVPWPVPLGAVAGAAVANTHAEGQRTALQVLCVLSGSQRSVSGFGSTRETLSEQHRRFVCMLRFVFFVRGLQIGVRRFGARREFRVGGRREFRAGKWIGKGIGG